MASRAAALVAGIIDRIENRPLGTGRPPMPTVKVVEALRFLFAKAYHGESCALSSGVLVVPPCAVAWTNGAPLPCYAGSMPPWSGWCAQGLRPLPGTWWSTAVRSGPSAAAS